MKRAERRRKAIDIAKSLGDERDNPVGFHPKDFDTIADLLVAAHDLEGSRQRALLKEEVARQLARSLPNFPMSALAELLKKAGKPGVRLRKGKKQ
jgi:hypothetical protein